MEFQRNTITFNTIYQKGKVDVIEVQIRWETGRTSTDTFDMMYTDKPVGLAIYTTYKKRKDERNPRD